MPSSPCAATATTNRPTPTLLPPARSAARLDGTRCAAGWPGAVQAEETDGGARHRPDQRGETFPAVPLSGPGSGSGGVGAGLHHPQPAQAAEGAGGRLNSTFHPLHLPVRPDPAPVASASPGRQPAYLLAHATKSTGSWGRCPWRREGCRSDASTALRMKESAGRCLALGKRPNPSASSPPLYNLLTVADVEVTHPAGVGSWLGPGAGQPAGEQTGTSLLSQPIALASDVQHLSVMQQSVQHCPWGSPDRPAVRPTRRTPWSTAGCGCPLVARRDHGEPGRRGLPVVGRNVELAATEHLGR